MRKAFLVLIVFISHNIYGQIDLNKIQIHLPHKLNRHYDLASQRNHSINFDDTIKVLAVMVDFQVDQDGATYGNGKFGSHFSKNYGKNIIDPLPHDRNYFKNHLEFLKNYYAKVSDGKIKISYEVLDRIITLSKVMSEYSPPPRSNDLTKLKFLYEETWLKVDSLYHNHNFTEYDAFVIFHAGVGRDIVIPETFGYEKDIPSVFLGLSTLKSFFGENFVGIPVGNPPKFVTNTLILPETESREIQTLTGKTLLELSINGLLCASFGSFLGLPDLFDSKTGKSAIGRFGLMDGQAMFAYAGLFPPELSAWEKQFLGLVKPIEIKSDTVNIEVLARLASLDNRKVLYKIPINSREYYLIENRQRDVRKDGIKIKSIISNSERFYEFASDFKGFRSYYVDSVDGVVVDVDEFDWALPGNGIVIWHIDEKIIAENFNSNTINANPKLKGIRVIEADGIQDIGIEFKNFFGDVIIGEGDSLDFWFKENSSRFYKNEFSNYTQPVTNSNNGAPSFIRILNFSSNANSMTFDVQFGSVDYKILHHTYFSELAKPDYVYSSSKYIDKIFIAVKNKLYLHDINLDSLKILTNEMVGYPAALDFNDSVYIAYLDSSSFNLIIYTGNQFVLNKISLTVLPLPILFAYQEPSGLYKFQFALSNGEILEYNISTSSIRRVNTLAELPIKGAYNSISNFPVYLSKTKILFGNKVFNLLNSDPIDLLIFSRNASGVVQDVKDFAVVFYKNGFVDFFDSLGIFARFTTDEKNISNDFSIGFFDINKNLSIVLNSPKKIVAKNIVGSYQNNFPVDAPSGTSFSGVVNLIDYNRDEISDLIVPTSDGRLVCFDGASGKILMQISTGYSISGNVYFVNRQDGLITIAIDDSGYVFVIKTSGSPKPIIWINPFGNASANSFITSFVDFVAEKDFMPASKVYNWPNPVYGDKTYFRLYVTEDALVNIRIYDLSGAFVDEVKGFAMGRVDNEFVWNVTNVQSGIYYARIEANSKTKSAVKIIKVAIVH